ncbi:hypothetical protein PV327_004664 [Microctonus hyperodae]|uniref:Odorant receptor n=1 Tax=Microctonus hyperodae TaxID=165561 RepID=A0AA39FD71_MICHY|nr:hypothetical protein PV327_004664 [Microctonus hyperodae]
MVVQKIAITNVPCISWEFEYMLCLISLWPNVYNILIGIILWSTWITIIPFQAMYISEISDNPVELMTSICDFASEISAFSRLFIAWSKRKVLLSLIIEMSEDWSKCKVKNTRETQVACFVGRLDFYIYCGAIVMFFPKLVIAYFTDIPENRQFLLKTSYPFVAYKSPIYEIIILLHFGQGMLMAISDVMPATLIVALVCHSGAQLNLLENQINQFITFTKNNDVTDRQMRLIIGEILTKHKKNINFTERIEKTLSIISLVQCLCNGVTIGCAGLVFVMENTSRISAAIANVIYESEWYHLNPKYVKILLLIILRGQIPFRLTAGGFFVLSAETFTLILKASGSYMSMLRATY